MQEQTKRNGDRVAEVFFLFVFLSFYFCKSLHFDFVTVSDCCFTVH